MATGYKYVRRSRAAKGKTTVYVTLAAARDAGKTIDDLCGLPDASGAPAHIRGKPLYAALRMVGLTQVDLAAKAGISVSSVNHACAGDAVHADTLFAIAAALGWRAHDVAEMIEAEPNDMTADELKTALEAAPGTLTHKAGLLGVSSRTLRRWMDGSRSIPPGLREQIAALGWEAERE